MSRYQIDWCEEKPTKVGPKYDCSVTDEAGIKTTGVTMWPKDWKEGVRPGISVLANLVVKKNGNFINKTLFPESAAPAWATAKPKEKDATINKAMDRKEQSIGKFQDNKEAQIQKMATFRDATLATNLYFERQAMPFSSEEYFAKWVEFRRKFDEKMGEPFN